jgi:DNA-binding Xre family transcriptional regulator
MSFKAEEIRVAMARKNMNIGEVADASGLTRETVSLIVNDKHSNARIETLEKIATALELDMAVVFTPAGQPAEVAA